MNTTQKFTYTLSITLRSGETHSFTVAKMPRFWKSWVMDQLPYGTNFQFCKFDRSRSVA